MSNRHFDERFREESSDVVTDLTSLTRRLAAVDGPANAFDKVGYDPSLPRRATVPNSLAESIKSGAIFGGVLAALAACLILGPQHLLLVLKWAFIGTAAGGALVIALKLLGAILEIAFRVIGFALIAIAILWLLQVVEKIH